MNKNEQNIYRNEYFSQIKGWLGKPLIKVITGLRRVGKSTLLEQISRIEQESVQDAKVIYINFELLENAPLNHARALHKYVVDQSKNKSALVLLDEIQECKDWEKAVNSLFAKKIYDLWITGSNANLLSSDLSTYLSGRYVHLQIFPLSFKEHLEFRKNLSFSSFPPEPFFPGDSVYPSSSINPTEEFALYLKHGGFPAIHFLQENLIQDYLHSLYNSILLRDIVERHQIRDVKLLDKIIHFLFDSVGSFISTKRITDFLKSQKISISQVTVQNYIYFLESCYAIIKVPRFDIKGKRFLETNEKYYLGDIGLRHGILGFKEKDIAGYLENIVVLELLRRGYSLGVGKIEDREVDFVAEKSGERIYIQVCYLLASEETIKREFSSLEAIKDNYPKYVLSLDPIPQSGRNGIIWKSIIDFLLN